MVQVILFVVASSYLTLVAGGKGEDPFKSAGNDDAWIDNLQKQVGSDPIAESTKSSDGKEESLDDLLAGLKTQMKDADGDRSTIQHKEANSIADAIKTGLDDTPGYQIDSLDTVDYEHDPMHLNDPLKDPNAEKVLEELGLTEEEKKALKAEKREDTTVDVAIKACYKETHEHGCTDHESPMRCLANAVRQKAAEISENCRRMTEKGLPYACSVELFITHCDGIEKPLIPCLDEHHPKLGPECLDVLTVTKKVMKTLKKRPKVEVPKPKPPPQAVRVTEAPESSASSILSVGFVVAGIALTLYFWKGGTVQDLQRKCLHHVRMIQKKLGLATAAPGKSSTTHDWTSAVDDQDEKVVNLNNFGSAGRSGGGYGGLS